ncbi:DUF5107 domain-containing protein [Zhihengliuella flava]|uniref:Tetratricopeptide (TPR) repeat protein n=1 Tax=Zhihengliuella flava TaxID=1285193 RepID=A0A931DCK4_9MICC|nr:DUF5107 domain-containing protein [Zhihengliuella flava]MBG6085051.1 tetratricopeptide (TPR) repeat protein [Zhihengliuella flava]
MLNDELMLPDRPKSMSDQAVAAWRAPVTIRTYKPASPSTLPTYLNERVYQGSSGRVYPLPFHERIEAEAVDHEWDAIHLENEWIRLVVLPELGGRIQWAIDRHSQRELFYNNPVIKPALVGLAGPWVAGGVEFNWPQHHRPATYLPTDTQIEHEEDGAATIWCSDHDPFERMKGMHGIRLSPGSSVIETRVRLFNRTAMTQTFLWWSNVAVRTGDDFQSFFPPDVAAVADHAKRAMTAFPAADRPYYDIDYPSRSADSFEAADGTRVTGDRIDWPRNIPVPTSYMVTDSDYDFFGGYDHATEQGFVHVADRRVAVGKKQWTWGEAEFGRAWNQNLTDDDSTYVELMAGVFTDNQPDFAFIAPGETKVFSQYWYPIRSIGPVSQASRDAALRVDRDGSSVLVSVVVTADRPGCQLVVLDELGNVITEQAVDLDPSSSYQWQTAHHDHARTIEVRHGNRVLVSQTLRNEAAGAGPSKKEALDGIQTAVEPANPQSVATVEELAEIGAHLDQYRHATRSPEPYWEEALTRDPANARVNTALGIRRLRQARLTDAARHFRTAIARATAYHPTPQDMSAHYYLGLTLSLSGCPDAAYDLFARAAWSRDWRAPATYQMAQLDAAAGRHNEALHRLNDVRRAEPENLQASALRIIILRRMGRTSEAEALVHEALALDRLHWWIRDLAGEALETDALTCMDVAADYVAAGSLEDALRVLDRALELDQRRAVGQASCTVLALLHRAEILDLLGRSRSAVEAREAAKSASRTWCFPGRLEDALMLQRSVDHDHLPVASALLGHWLYGVGRHDDAVTHWRTAAQDLEDAIVHRNIGLALAARQADDAGARAAYDVALALDPTHSGLLRESDQLDKRRGVSVNARLARLQQAEWAIAERDDLAAELAQLLLSAVRPEDAYRLLSTREFRPWEGGEGEVLRVWERACSALARRCLQRRQYDEARMWVGKALQPPATLGEARHPLATTARLKRLSGDIAAAAGQLSEARLEWESAARHIGDFRTMSASRHSESTYDSILSLQRLGRSEEALRLTRDLREFVEELANAEPAIDYFATSLPELLLFPPDLRRQRDIRVQFFRAQLEALESADAAVQRLQRILDRVPDHPDAHDLLTEIKEQE